MEGPAKSVSINDAISDEEVVSRVLAGALQEFEVLMRRYNRRLYRVVRSILPSETETEDVVQDAYVRAYTHLDQFQRRAAFSTWLTRIAVYEALARKREHQRLVEIDSLGEAKEANMAFLTSPSPDPEQQALIRSVGNMLESAVDSLPVNYRAVFMLREV